MGKHYFWSVISASAKVASPESQFSSSATGPACTFWCYKSRLTLIKIDQWVTIGYPVIEHHELTIVNPWGGLWGASKTVMAVDDVLLGFGNLAGHHWGGPTWRGRGGKDMPSVRGMFVPTFIKCNETMFRFIGTYWYKLSYVAHAQCNVVDVTELMSPIWTWGFDLTGFQFICHVFFGTTIKIT